MQLFPVCAVGGSGVSSKGEGAGEWEGEFYMHYVGSGIIIIIIGTAVL